MVSDSLAETQVHLPHRTLSRLSSLALDEFQPVAQLVSGFTSKGGVLLIKQHFGANVHGIALSCYTVASCTFADPFAVII